MRPRKAEVSINLWHAAYATTEPRSKVNKLVGLLWLKREKSYQETEKQFHILLKIDNVDTLCKKQGRLYPIHLIFGPISPRRLLPFI